MSSLRFSKFIGCLCVQGMQGPQGRPGIPGAVGRQVSQIKLGKNGRFDCVNEINCYLLMLQFRQSMDLQLSLLYMFVCCNVGK